MDPIQVGKAFTEFYYNTFDADRSQLVTLYRTDSMLTFERAQILGVSGIVEKLVSLPFKKVVHVVNPADVDVQPSKHHGAILVSVTGLLKVDEESNPLSFSQIFQLVNENGSYYVHNDIFRLNNVG